MLNDFQKIEFCRLKHTLNLRRQFNASSRSEPGRSEITAIAAYQPEADIDVHLTQVAGGRGLGVGGRELVWLPKLWKVLSRSYRNRFL